MKIAAIRPPKLTTALSLGDVKAWFDGLSIDDTKVEIEDMSRPCKICFKASANDHVGKLGIRFKGEKIDESKVETLDVYSLHSSEIDYECKKNKPVSFQVSTPNSKATIWEKMDQLMIKLFFAV